MVVERLLSFWEGNFSGAMLNFGRVVKKTSWWLSFNPFEKYAQVKLDHESPIFGVKIPKIFELPPPRKPGLRGGSSQVSDTW